MATETLRQLSHSLFEFDHLAEKITIVWHAGEPLAVPIAFYEEAIDVFAATNDRGVAVKHSIQTNGTLINQEWCDFFKRHEIEVGVSIDGPRQLHDKFRKDRAGRGSYDRTMRGVSLLQKNDIDFSVITVLTECSLNYPDAIWDFFVKNRITRLAFNIEEKEGANQNPSLENRLLARDKASTFFARLLTLWTKHPDKERISVREIDGLLNIVRNCSSDIRATENTPLAILNFDWQGNFSTFSPELLATRDAKFKDFVFGNVFTHEIHDLLLNKEFLEVNRLIQNGVKRCKDTCQYFELCGGGPPVNKLCENGTFDSTETLYCLTKIQAPADVVLNHLEERYCSVH